MNIPFESILPVIALLAWAITEYMPKLNGAAKPLFLAALASAVAVVSVAVFKVEYQQAFNLILATLGGSFVNSVVNNIPGGKSLKKDGGNANTRADP